MDQAGKNAKKNPGGVAGYLSNLQISVAV